MCYIVYILYSASLDRYYKGQTKDLDGRIYRHNHKQEKSTQNGAPWTLVWSTKKESRSSAVLLERKLKNLTNERVLKFISKYNEGICDHFLPPISDSGEMTPTSSIAGPDDAD